MKKILCIAVVLWSMSAGAQRIEYDKYGDGLAFPNDMLVTITTIPPRTVTMREYFFFNDDSAKQRVSGIILKGREADIVCYMVKNNPSDFPILDSVIKAIYIVKPGNNDSVTFNVVPNKEWVRMFKKVQNNPTSIIKKAFDNILKELLLHGGSFIVHRVNIEVNISEEDFDAMKKIGQDYAQKKDEGGY